MEDMEMETLGANCANDYYNHPKDPHGHPRQVTRAGDRIMCRLMSGALFFIYKRHKETGATGMETNNDERLKEYVRCGILNMFAKFLKESACKGDWGLWYAWYTMEQMDEYMGGVMKRVNCANEVYQNIQAGGWSMEQSIKQWLSTNKTLKDKMGKEGVSNICNWALDTDGNIKGGKTKGDAGNTRDMKAKNVTKKLTEGIKDIFVDMKQEVTETIQRQRHTQQAPGVQGVQTTSGSSSSTSTPPGTSEPGTADNVAGAVATHADGSKPADTATPETTPSKDTSVEHSNTSLTWRQETDGDGSTGAGDGRG
ncbi:hypothetical protein AK88_05364 [Plasmodium fragile]|uniref:Uncharacterized protein n=1 Tax=Plasmodium fragile TaxID=5857 RepID=A0A0D9QDF3_PLAFR|nr:uncharacterized protein AK88_05364 [Plasmodium fragile]KJP85009.1 hypothetical protein AK88_05364 [Plasmodium fragile]